MPPSVPQASSATPPLQLLHYRHDEKESSSELQDYSGNLGTCSQSVRSSLQVTTASSVVLQDGSTAPGGLRGATLLVGRVWGQGDEVWQRLQIKERWEGGRDETGMRL